LPARARARRAVCGRALRLLPRPASGEREKRSTLHRCNHLLDQTPEAADIAGGIDGVAETNDHQMLRRNNNDALAEIAGGKKRVARNPEPDAALGIFMLAAIGPEAGAVVGIERCGGRKIYPVFLRDSPAADHPVIQIEQSE